MARAGRGEARKGGVESVCGVGVPPLAARRLRPSPAGWAELRGLRLLRRWRISAHARELSWARTSVGAARGFSSRHSPHLPTAAMRQPLFGVLMAIGCTITAMSSFIRATSSSRALTLGSMRMPPADGSPQPAPPSCVIHRCVATGRVGVFPALAYDNPGICQWQPKRLKDKREKAKPKERGHACSSYCPSTCWSRAFA
jgi:hypothetical protein